MLTEYVMHKYNWTDIWYAHPGPWISPINLRKRYCVGIWTGRDNDLLCLKKCKTNPEAEIWLSPAGSLIITALIKAMIKRWRLRRKVK